MDPKRIDLEKMREQITKRKLVIENLSREEFCEILDGLPAMFRFKLTNVRDDFDGYWEKTILAGKTVWHKDGKYLSSYSFFEFKEEVFNAIEREGREPLSKLYQKDESARIVRKKGEIIQTLTKEKLKWIYYRENKSLEDIAKEYGTTRQNILRIMKKHEIIRRGQSKARIEAIKKGKFERFEYQEITEDYFSEWSSGMAWVLGLLFTDGNISKGSVVISSIDIDLLEKIKKLLNSSNPIAKRIQSYDKSKHIYVFGFSREKMTKDLNRLGLYEKKSLDMVFPDVPEEYMRHFIRGCWDGDGSIFFDQNKLVASYVSGSKKFIERLVQELNSIGISRGHLSYRIEQHRKRGTEVMRSNYPDGKIPLAIQEYKRSNAYYIKSATKENIERLFHYFYDGVDESMYLSRKHEVFVKGLKLDGKGEKEQLNLDLDF